MASQPIDISPGPTSSGVHTAAEEMEELSGSPSSFCTASGSPIPYNIPLPSSPILGSSSHRVSVNYTSPTSQPIRLPPAPMAANIVGTSEHVEPFDHPASPPQPVVTRRQSIASLPGQQQPLVRVQSHQQQVANNIKQPKRVSSVMGFGGHFSPPGTPENESAIAGEPGSGQASAHVRRKSSIHDILSTLTSSPTLDGPGHGRRRSIVSVLLRKGSDDQAVVAEPVAPKVIHESSPASTMLSTLPPRISSKRSTPNLGRPPFPSAHSSPVVQQYAPFDPRYRPQVMPFQQHGMGMHSPTSPVSPHGFPMPPPHMPMRRPAPPAIHVPPSRSASPASRLSSPSTASLRSSTPNLRSSFLGVRKDERDVGEKRVSTLNLPPMGFQNSVAPKFSRGGARRSGVVMPTPAHGGGSRRPMSHLPSVSSLNTVDEMGTLGGGRARHSAMPMHSATLGALEGARQVYKRGSTNSLSSMHSSTSDVSASASQRSVQSPTCASHDKDTLETLLESASHSRQASADLPVPNAAFMRQRQGSAVSTDSGMSTSTSIEEDAGFSASVPSLSTDSNSSSDHSMPQTPDLDGHLLSALPPRVDSRPAYTPSVAEDDDAIEEVLAADDGYMRSLNARLQIDVRIEGTSRADPSAFAPAPIPSPRIITSEDDDTELPYTRGSEEFGVLPSMPSAATIQPSQSFSRRFFGFGDKSLKGMSSTGSLRSLPSKASFASLRGKDRGTPTTRGRGQMKEVVMSPPMEPVKPSPASKKGTEKANAAEKTLKPRKSAVFLGKLGRAFGVKRKDAPPLPVSA